MAAVQAQAGGVPQRSITAFSTVMLFVRLAALAFLNVVAFWLAAGIWGNGNYSLAIVIVVIALGVTVINLWPTLWPLRWLAPGLALMTLLAVYPLFYTVYVAFTNFSDGHRNTRAEAVQLLSREKYLPADSESYRWELYKSDTADEYALWLTASDGIAYFAIPGQPLQPVTLNESGEGPYEDGLPASINGFSLLSGGDKFRALRDANLESIQFGDEQNPVGITSRTAAGNFLQKWVFDEERNALVDMETNTPYRADDTTGDFIAPNGQRAPLGYWVPVGFDNFTRIFTSIAISGPLIRVFLWTVAFAFFSVLTSFAAGLLMALLMNKPFPGVRFVKSLMIIPYAVPGMISILIWRGMLNPNGGVIATSLSNIGLNIPWMTDPGWAKAAVLMVNLWLSFPYFMLICTGALQSISSSIYEAAEVDGANAWQRFWNLTLPLLLVAVGPLLIASFTFNFNNFLLIEALFKGGPGMVGTSAPPVGHTDNLVSYTYRFAFGAGGARDFGFASAISIIIFLMVGGLTLLQFRVTKRWEEVGDNV